MWQELEEFLDALDPVPDVISVSVGCVSVDESEELAYYSGSSLTPTLL